MIACTYTITHNYYLFKYDYESLTVWLIDSFPISPRMSQNSNVKLGERSTIAYIAKIISIQGCYIYTTYIAYAAHKNIGRLELLQDSLNSIHIYEYIVILSIQAL